MEAKIKAYSPDTNTYYDSFDDLVAAEANGFVIVGLSTRVKTLPIVVGPFPTKKDAQRAQQRYRRRWTKEESEHGNYKVSVYVRHLWKEF